MAERVRGTEEPRDQARPVGCPWQLLQYTTQKIRCANWQGSALMDCEVGCEMYQHLQGLNALIADLKSKIPNADCIACSKRDISEKGGQA